jgi:glycosyltransferase involved in cell wall biosynthesis
VSLRVLAIEPYYGGSHRAFLDGLVRHSRHEWRLLTMPARKWKWRMRGAALTFAERLDGDFDLLFASDFLDLATLVALRPERLRRVPKVAYFHENQLTYPVPREEERDYQFGFTNITTCLAADHVFFNSAFHRREFLDAVGDLLSRMPDEMPHAVPQTIADRSTVLPLGCELSALVMEVPPRSGPPLILWNHRWEYDKGPEDFFSVLFDLDAEGLPFRLAVAGETFRQAPVIFDVAKRRLAERIEHFGFLESRQDYARLLHRADIAVSTALHEFFGIAAIEAVYCGAYPLWPHRLTYPELLPESLRGTHLYSTHEELASCLRHALTHIDDVRETDLRDVAAQFDWPRRISDYDSALEDIAAAH